MWTEPDPRGLHPYFFACDPPDAERWGGYDGIPGVERAPGGVKCTLDAAPDIAVWTETKWTPPVTPPLSAKTRARLERLGLWPHQIEGTSDRHGGVHWIATHAQGILSDPTRAGKTGQCIGAVIARDFQRCLIVAVLPSARAVWARQIEAFTAKDNLIGAPDPVLMLYGRAADRGRWWGAKRFLRDDELEAALMSARWVVVNPEILHGHVTANRRGVVGTVEALPGWADRLGSYRWDIAFVDEAHRASGWRAAEGANRRLAIKQTLRNVPRVWAVTATPARGGMTKHLWGVLDITSNGLWGEEPWRFLKRYSNAQHVERQIGKGRVIRVWDDNGRSNMPELKARLFRYCVRRPRAVFAPFMPRKIQEIVWLEREADELASYVAAAYARTRGAEVPGIRSKVSHLMAADLKVTLPAMIERAEGDIEAGEKIYILVARHASLAEVTKAIQRNRILKRAPFFTLHGNIAQDDRDPIAQAFVKTKGAAIMLANIDAVPGAISLRGVHQEYWLEVTSDPVNCQQAGDRPFEPGITRGLQLTYFAVRNSIGQHALELLLPKIETLALLQDQDDIVGLSAAIRNRPSEDETLVEVWARLEAHLKAEDE